VKYLSREMRSLFLWDEDHFTGVNPVKNKPLAEKTAEDVLLHFGDTLKVARKLLDTQQIIANYLQ